MAIPFQEFVGRLGFTREKPPWSPDQAAFQSAVGTLVVQATIAAPLRMFISAASRTPCQRCSRFTERCRPVLRSE